MVRSPENPNQFIAFVGFMEFIEERQEGVHSPQSMVRSPWSAVHKIETRTSS